MSMNALQKIFATLPEPIQKIAVMQAMERMLANGQWPAANEIASQIQRQPELLELHEAAAFVEIRALLRLRELERAFHTYARLRPGLVACEALYQLAANCLPNCYEKVVALWQKLSHAQPDLQDSLPGRLITSMLEDARIALPSCRDLRTA